MQSTLMQQGFDLMLYGMGTVFIFLALLVVGTVAMSKIVAKFFPDVIEPAPQPTQSVAVGSVDSRTLAIIKDAIKQHRSRR